MANPGFGLEVTDIAKKPRQRFRRKALERPRNLFYGISIPAGVRAMRKGILAAVTAAMGSAIVHYLLYIDVKASKGEWRSSVPAEWWLVALAVSIGFLLISLWASLSSDPLPEPSAAHSRRD